MEFQHERSFLMRDFRLRFFFLKEEMAIMCVRSTGIRL